MKVVLRLLLGGACLTLVPDAPAAEQAYVVSYVETAPAQQENAAELFRRLAMLSLKETGSVRFEVLRRIGYPDQFAVLEVWEDLKAREAHVAAAHTQLFRDKLKPLLRAPYDERPHICRGFDNTECDVNAPGARALTLREPAEFLRWLEAKRPRLHAKLEGRFTPERWQPGTKAKTARARRAVARKARS